MVGQRALASPLKEALLHKTPVVQIRNKYSMSLQVTTRYWYISNLRRKRILAFYCFAVLYDFLLFFVYVPVTKNNGYDALHSWVWYFADLSYLIGISQFIYFILAAIDLLLGSQRHLRADSLPGVDGSGLDSSMSVGQADSSFSSLLSPSKQGSSGLNTSLDSPQSPFQQPRSTFATAALLPSVAEQPSVSIIGSASRQSEEHGARSRVLLQGHEEQQRYWQCKGCAIDVDVFHRHRDRFFAILFPLAVFVCVGYWGAIYPTNPNNPGSNNPNKELSATNFLNNFALHGVPFLWVVIELVCVPHYYGRSFRSAVTEVLLLFIYAILYFMLNVEYKRTQDVWVYRIQDQLTWKERAVVYPCLLFLLLALYLLGRFVTYRCWHHRK